jgi:3-hydroxy-9,10-secoandrosta-1,3,5(10)-triene-9,17-dione monooxygenase
MAAELVERAKAMKPLLKERAAKVEEDRIVGSDTISEFREAGFFKIFQPKAYGGYELPPGALMDVIFEVASACGSSGWVLAVLALHQWEVPLLSEDAIAEIWGENPGALLSSAYAPTGNVQAVERGYLLNGRWPFSSGCDHAQWAIVGGLRPPRHQDGAPTICGFFVPRSDYEILDDWQTLGLAGTGSKSLMMNDVFVPERRHRPIMGASPPPPSDAGPLYRIAHSVISLEPLVAAAHGMAQGVLDRFIERTKLRIGTFDRTKYSDNPDFHRHIAETDYAIRAARALSRANLEAAFDAASQGCKPPVIDLARHFWEGARSVHACTEMAARLVSISGAHVILAGDPLQRAFRDLQSAATHTGFNFNFNGRNYGAMQLGHPNALPLI